MKKHQEHVDFMKHAITIAEKSRGQTTPNPFVGAVIVKNNIVIGEGRTQKTGSNHAEIQAIKKATKPVKGSTLYVTLEPCCHHGKTPPCTDTIIKAGITKVVIGIKDPNPLVAGKGIKQLKKAGIEVITGILKKEITKQNEIFLHFIQTKRPFVCMKIASSIDGKITAKKGKQTKLTGKKADKWVHTLRSQYNAIMVGTNTAIIDNPALTVRHIKGKNPTRIILDKDLKIPESAKIYHQNQTKVIVATSSAAPKNKRSKLLQNTHIEIIDIPVLKNKKLNIRKLFSILGSKGISSIFIEGGTTLNTHLIENRLINKIYTVITPHIIGTEGVNMTDTCKIHMDFEVENIQQLGGDVVLEYKKVKA
jgi:diaminohydroxyphosphoribosylaminopyrimidine deaminase/5-amino-6-(5-phosphoribosylamino)uracil reductase